MTDGPGTSPPVHLYRESWKWLERRDAGEPGVEVRIETWLAEDPRRRQVFAEAEAAWRESRLMPEGAGGFDGKLMRAPFYERRPVQSVLAAVTAFAAAGLGTAWLARADFYPHMVSPAQAATYETGLGQIRTYRLADTTAITLDTDTRIELTVSDKGRRIQLARGRLRVDNAPPGSSFEVSAGSNSATVSGSGFDASFSGTSLSVAAARNEIGLSAADPETGAPRILKAGSQVVIGRPASAARISRVDLEWVSGMLSLDGSRLDEAVAAINRYNAVQVRLAAAGIGARRISGAFPATDPDGFALAIARMLDLRIERPRPGEIVLSPR